MKVLILTQRDPFFVDAFLKEFDKSGIDFQVLNLPNFNKGLLWGLKRAKDLYGYFGLIKLVPIAVKNKIFFSLKNCISIINIDDMNVVKKYVSKLKHDDYFLSLSAPSRIPTEEYNFNGKMLNIHCGKLPDYAGMMPIFWQLLDQKDEISITFHNLSSNIDGGSVLYEKVIKFNKTLFQTSVNAKKESAKIFSKIVRGELKLKDSYSETIHNTHKPNLNKFPAKSDIVELRKIIKLI